STTDTLSSCPPRGLSASPDTAPPELYTLSLQTLFRSMGVLLSAKPAKDITRESGDPEADDDDNLAAPGHRTDDRRMLEARSPAGDRKSTRLNSSHVKISYAGFCLKKKKQPQQQHPLAP